MIRFDGNRTFTLPPADVFAKLTDARFLVTCIPDVETLNKVEANEASLVLRPGLSFMRGTLNLTLQIAEAAPPGHARFILITKGIGSSTTVEATLTLAPLADGAHVHW